MASSITYKNDAFPEGQVFGLFNLFQVENGKKYTLTAEDETNFEQTYGYPFSEHDKPHNWEKNVDDKQMEVSK